MTIQDPHSPETIFTLKPFGMAPADKVYGDPADPTLASDLDSLDGHEAQDAEYDRRAAEEDLFAFFIAGVIASDGLGTFGIDDPAFALGEQVGWMLRGAVALNPDLAPILKALTK